MKDYTQGKSFKPLSHKSLHTFHGGTKATRPLSEAPTVTSGGRASAGISMQRRAVHPNLACQRNVYSNSWKLASSRCQTSTCVIRNNLHCVRERKKTLLVQTPTIIFAEDQIHGLFFPQIKTFAEKKQHTKYYARKGLDQFPGMFP